MVAQASVIPRPVRRKGRDRRPADPLPLRRKGSVPLVTVGLPVCNGENLVERAVESILAQDHPNLQIIVADDGSTDRTEPICRALARRDGRVEYHRNPVHRGAAWNYNRVVRLAQGSYFKWATHLDLCAPTLVSSCLTALGAASSAAVLAYPKTSLINLNDAVIGDFEDGMDLREGTPHERLRHLLSARPEYHPVFGVIRKKALLETSLIGKHAGADLVLLAELALRGQFVEVPERLFLRRRGEGATGNAGPGAGERVGWSDPNRRAPSLPRTRQTLRMARAIRSYRQIGRGERARCLAVLGQHWAFPHARHMGGEVGTALADLLAAPFRPGRSG
jgi:Glycosyl transferase family 2